MIMLYISVSFIYLYLFLTAFSKLFPCQYQYDLQILSGSFVQLLSNPLSYQHLLFCNKIMVQIVIIIAVKHEKMDIMSATVSFHYSLSMQQQTYLSWWVLHVHLNHHIPHLWVSCQLNHPSNHLSHVQSPTLSLTNPAVKLQKFRFPVNIRLI